MVRILENPLDSQHTLQDRGNGDLGELEELTEKIWDEGINLHDLEHARSSLGVGYGE